MVNGSDVLTKPLTKIINESIVTGKFPNQWKEAIITPVLKNGDRELLKNYRPASCLAAASKLLEKIVCAQVSEFFEVNNKCTSLFSAKKAIKCFTKCLPI